MPSARVQAFVAAIFAAIVSTSAAAFFSVPPRPADSVLAPFKPPAVHVDAAALENDKLWLIGRQLFFDPIASGSGRIACATCHRPDKAWSVNEARSRGDNGQQLPFKSPTLIGVGQLDRLGWTGRFADTAAVAAFAMSSANNMNMPLDRLTAVLDADKSYSDQFRAAFGHPKATEREVATALMRFVNTINAAPTAFDTWVGGNDEAISASAKRGFALFNGKARCASCHSGWSFTDGSYHDIGTATSDFGRGQFFPTSVKLQHAFKTPTLRGATLRAPYMHGGDLADLDAVIELYNRGGIDRPSRANEVQPLHLSTSEKDDLKAFLETLSGDTDFAAIN